MKTRACHTHTHMTVATIDGEKTIIYNWSCLPHGIARKAYRSRKARNTALLEHMEKRLKKELKSSELALS